MHRMHARITLALLVSILVVPAGAPAASGPWTDPATLDRGLIGGTDIVFGEDGRFAAIWLRGGREVRALVPPAVRPVTVTTGPRGRIGAPEIARLERGGAV